MNVRNPRAVAITNDGDTDDSDEKVVVTEFYGRKTASAEGTDSSREGAVKVFTLSAAGALAEDGEVLFAPGADGGFGVGFSPNQLFNVAIQNDHLYVPAIGASPAGPPQFSQNVAPLVLVASLSTKTEITTAAGSQSLAPLVNAFPAPQIFLADLVDLSFLGSTNVAYAVCYIRSKTDQPGLRLLVGSSDAAKVYLNGKQIHRHSFPRNFVADQDIVEGIALNAGLNVLVFKVVNKFIHGQGSIRFTDTAGNPIRGIQLTLDPDVRELP